MSLFFFELVQLETDNWRDNLPVCTYPIKVPYCRSTTFHAVGGDLGEIHVSCIPLRCKSVDALSKHHITALDSDVGACCKIHRTKCIKILTVKWRFKWKISNLRHHFGFLNKIIFGHCAPFHHFDCGINGTTPFTSAYNTKLARAKLFQQHQFGWMDFPFIMWETGRWWYWSIAWWWLQSTSQTARIMTMIIYQIGNSLATMLLWQVILISAILLNVIMFDMWLWAVIERKKTRNWNNWFLWMRLLDKWIL